MLLSFASRRRDWHQVSKRNMHWRYRPMATDDDDGDCLGVPGTPSTANHHRTGEGDEAQTGWHRKAMSALTLGATTGGGCLPARDNGRNSSPSLDPRENRRWHALDLWQASPQSPSSPPVPVVSPSGNTKFSSKPKPWVTRQLAWVNTLMTRAIFACLGRSAPHKCQTKYHDPNFV